MAGGLLRIVGYIVSNEPSCSSGKKWKYNMSPAIPLLNTHLREIKLLNGRDIGTLVYYNSIYGSKKYNWDMWPSVE